MRCEIRSSFSRREHWHPYYKLIFLPDDACEVELFWRNHNGAAQTASLRGCNIIFISKNTPYSINWKQTSNIGWVCFGERFLSHEAQVAKWQGVMYRHETELAGRELAIHQLMVLYSRLVRNQEYQQGFYAQSVSQALATLALRSSQAEGLDVQNKSSPDDYKLNMVQRAIDYIKANLGTPIRVKEIAREVGICEDHFTRVFKAYTGYTPKHYIAMTRVERAQGLLLERQRGGNQMSMSEIALESGFYDQSHFGECIKRFLDDSGKEVGFLMKKSETSKPAHQ